MTIRNPETAPFANRIGGQLGCGFFDPLRTAGVIDDLRDRSHDLIYQELNSENQAQNSLTSKKLPDYRSGMKWDERLREAFERTGWTKSKLSRESGVPDDSVRKYLAGKVEKPRGDTLDKLAFALNVDPLFLREGIRETVSAKLISWVSAGALVIPDAPIDFDGAETITTSDIDPSGNWIALEVDGDSMDRISPPGSIIFVDLDDRKLVPNGCYIIVDERGGASYKRFRPSPDRWEPVSTNPNHEPIFVRNGGGPSVIGRVRKSLLSM